MPAFTVRNYFAWTVFLLAGPTFLSACSPREASEAPVQSDVTAKELAGRRIAENLCAGCHAIGAEGESPHADAPPFHTLSDRYPVRLLEEALAEGIAVGHPDMPEFEFSAEEVDQLITYLESVQPK